MKKHIIDSFEINKDTMPIVSQLAEQIPGGFFIYHADGDQKLIYFNSYLPTIYGFDNAEDFVKHVNNSFKGMVHPDDYHRNESETEFQIKQNDENVDHVKYKFIRKDGSIGMMDDYGHFSHSKTFGDIYYVFVQDISDQYKKDQRQQAIRNEVINQMLGGESTYIVNLLENSFDVLQQNPYLQKNYPVEENYTDSIGRYIDNDVNELDRENLKNLTSLENLKKEFSSKSEITTYFRDISSGISKWYQMRAVRVSESEALIGFVDYDNRYYDNLFREKIDQDYFGLYIADLDDKIVKIAKSSPYYRTGNKSETVPYMPALLAFANLNEGDAKEFFKNLADINYINRVFKDEDKISYSYKSPVVQGKKWVTAECTILSRHKDGTPAYFALGFRILDSLSSEKNDLQEKYNEIREVMEILSEDFGCVNYIEFKDCKENDVCVNYRTSSLLKRLVPGWEKEVKFFEKIRLLSERVVLPEEKDEFYNQCKRSKILEELKDKDTYYVNFKAFFDNDIKFYQIKISAIRRNGELVGVVSGIRSVDDYIKKEIEYQNKLQAALDDAENANKSKTKFLFNMSHDIRTPMNAILGFTNMAKKHLDDKEKTSDFINKIEISSQQLLNLINQILEMSRIESGKIELEEDEIDIMYENAAMSTVLSEQANEKGLIFKHSMNNVKHNYVIADRAKVSSIMLNIIGNALKYTPSGGTVSFDLVEIQSRKEGYASFICTMADTGIGMSEEYLKVLFEPFTREKNSTISKIQGTGLGMAIVSELVKLMGGDIKVDSKVGKGTTVAITLDFKIDHKKQKHIDNHKKVKNNVFVGKRILLVEDNEMNREIAKDILEDQGFIIESAEDGDIAVKMVKNKFLEGDFFYYDFILMDIQMPRMNGFEATKEIREIEKTNNIHTPIIAMTANAFEEDRRNALNAGMDEHCPKPIDIEKLLDLMSKFVS